MNGDAEELTRVLREMFQGDVADPMTITSDTRTNSIIVRGSPGKLAIVEATLLRLDE